MRGVASLTQKNAELISFLPVFIQIVKVRGAHRGSKEWEAFQGRVEFKRGRGRMPLLHLYSAPQTLLGLPAHPA